MPIRKKEQQDDREMEEEADINFFLIELELGEGPMRFAEKGEHSLAQQLEDLKKNDRRCINNLKQRWQENNASFDFPEEMYLRFARSTAKKKGFNEDKAFKYMRKFNKRYLKLSAHQLEKQLMTKVSVVLLLETLATQKF
jgi:hypothetical protein